MGLDNAGKTTLFCMMTQSFDASRQPGPFMVYSTGLTRYEYFDASCSYMRDSWRWALPFDAIVFVVDAADRDRFDEARDELHLLLREPALAEVPCVVLGNKIDRPRAVSENDLREALELSPSGDVVIQCHAAGDGCLACTTLAGAHIGAFPVPQGQVPFGRWAVDHVIKACPEKCGQFRLVDPGGGIFATKKVFSQEYGGHHVALFMASVHKFVGCADALRWLSAEIRGQ
jgi:hypothetical protein